MDEFDNAHDHLLPTAEEEYEDACERTLARRLLIELGRLGVIGEYSMSQLLYPSQEAIDEATNG